MIFLYKKHLNVLFIVNNDINHCNITLKSKSFWLFVKKYVTNLPRKNL